MGITLFHFGICFLLMGAFFRTVTYLLLSNNPDSRVGKFLAYAG